MREKVLSHFVCITICICAVLFFSGCKKDIKVSISFFVEGKTYLTVESNGKSIKEMPKDPEKTGYEFDGWFFDKGTFKNEFTKDSLAKDPIKEDIVIYAGFSAIEYTATFKNGNDTVDTRTFTIEERSISNLPTVPSKTGYNGAWESYRISANDITINAVYTPIEYTISYTNLEGATNSNVGTYNIETPTISLTDLSKDGYTFDGWFNGEDEVTEITLGSTNNIELEAKWTLIEYTATFKNGNEEVATRTFNVEDTVIEDLPTVPAKDYYNGVWDRYTISANDMTINAVYTPTEYTITYTNTKDATNSNVNFYDIETPTISLTDLSKDGYTFNGWFIGENKVTEITLGSTGNKSLRAEWSIVNYTISYTNLEGATNSNEENYNIETIITLSDLSSTRDGYIFDGWFVGEDKVTEIALGSFGNKSLRAEWALIEYTATFKNGADIVDTRTFTVEDTVIDNLPTVPAKDYYTGVWESYTITASDIEINAVYTLIEYTISYELDGGTNNPSNPETYNIDNEAIHLMVPTKEGKLFNGWEKDGVFIVAFSSYLAANITIEATWIDEVQLTYTIDSNDNVIITGFENDSIKTTLRILNIAETYDDRNVVGIGVEAFKDYSELRIVTMPDSIESIDGYAFYDCSMLERITIPNSLKNIGYCAFYDCSSLIYKEEENICYLGNDTNPYYVAMQVTDKTLTSYTINSATKIIYDCFSDCSNITSMTIPEGVVSIGNGAFAYCSNLESVTLSNSVEIIDDYAFQKCGGLKNITFGDSLKTIGELAFQNCISLQSVIMPNSVESIGVSAFYGCINLKSVTISNKLKKISNSAFSDCTYLENLIIPKGVETIDSFAFYNCKNLESITIPSSVVNINSSVFQNCEKLKNVYIQSAEVAKDITRYNYSGYIVAYAETIYFEESIITIGSYITSNFTKDSTLTTVGNVVIVTYDKYIKNA